MAIYPDERPSWYLETARVLGGSLKYGDLRLLNVIKDCPELSEVAGVPVERTQRIFYSPERITFRIYFVNEREVARFDGDPFYRVNGRIRTPEWFKWRVDRALGKDVLPFYVFEGERDRDIAKALIDNMRAASDLTPETNVIQLAERAHQFLVQELQEYARTADCPLILRAAWPQLVALIDHDNGAEIRRDAIACDPFLLALEDEVDDAEVIASMYFDHLKFRLMMARLQRKREPIGQILVLYAGPMPGPKIFDPATLAVRPRPWFMRAGVLNVEPPR